MKTELTTSPEVAASFIERGGIVAFPTETVYGLGADAFNEKSVARIFEAKQRPADNPLIAHIGNIGQLDRLAAEIPESASRLIASFFPGPLTLVLKKTDSVADIVAAGLDTVGVRMPSSTIARELLAHCRNPVAAPSANLSGRPSPTTWQAVLEDLDGRIDCILQGPIADIGLESTVVDCTSATPVILRSGSVSIEDLRSVVPDIRLHTDTPGTPARSPGMRHRHYAPRARVLLIDSPSEISAASDSAYIGLSEPLVSVAKMGVYDSISAYARRVFAFFRECDRAGISTIYCQRVEESGIGAALMDRIRRAAQGG